MLEEITDLEAFIDHHYNCCKVPPGQKTELEVSVLQSINKRLDLLLTLHKEIKELCWSLEFAHNNIRKVDQSNNYLQTIVKKFIANMDLVMKENKTMNENISDIQTRSMCDNSIFSSIPHPASDNQETLIKDST